MDSFKHDVPTAGAGQANFQQCWYASFGMIYKFHNLPVASIDDKLSGAGIDVPDAKATGLTDREYKKSAEALGLTAFSSVPFKKTSVLDFDVSSGATAFITELKKGPLWVSRYVGPGSYHATVATGYSDDGKGYIIFNNPFPGPTNAKEDSSMTATVFVKHITDARGSVIGRR